MDENQQIFGISTKTGTLGDEKPRRGRGAHDEEQDDTKLDEI